AVACRYELAVPTADGGKPDFKVDLRIAAGLDNRLHAAEGRQVGQHWRPWQCKVARWRLCNGLDPHGIQLQSCDACGAAGFGRHDLRLENRVRVGASGRQRYSENKRQRAGAKM